MFFLLNQTQIRHRYVNLIIIQAKPLFRCKNASTALCPLFKFPALPNPPSHTHLWFPGGATFKAHRTCSTDFSDNGSTDGGLSSTEELDDEGGSTPPAKPPLPPKAKNTRPPSIVSGQVGAAVAQRVLSESGVQEKPPTLPPKRSQSQTTAHLRSDVVTRL